MAKVVLKNVYKSYGEVKAIRGVNLSCEEGQLLALLGPSGAGKTTTLKLIAGLEKCDGGEIFLNDRNVNEVSPFERNVAMTFENYALYPHFTVFENLAFPLRSPRRRHIYSEKDVRKKVEEIATLLGIHQLLDRRPTQLSGGQRQRVSLGRMLVTNPDVFLMDEPIAHLDAKLRYFLTGEIKKLQKRLGVTTIYTTHDYMEALAIGDRVAVINTGKVLQVGSPDEIFNRPNTEFIGKLIGDPPMNVLECEIVKKEKNYFLKIGELIHPLSARMAEKLLQEVKDGKSRVGIRPTDMQVSREKIPGYPEMEVYVSEPLGDKEILTLKKGNVSIQAKIKAGLESKVGEHLWVKFDFKRLHFFDRETGNRIHLDVEYLVL
ncbi:ABC transporter ATP-binding protein [Candidatus Aerophobetes bacterium]|nr:ABC transporter ATP-binding protein [Candidatus Aerophobetes bacterium]